jgi:hypothetical protein
MHCAWEKAAAGGKIFAFAHLVIILACKSADAGRNGDRKLKQIHKDHEIT